MNRKALLVSILIAAALIVGAIFLAAPRAASDSGDGKNVRVEGGTQIITITAKGGYSPKVTTAKAGMPTVIHMDTRGTFDCSSAVVIPSLSYRGNLPPSGETSIDVPPQQAGSTMRGLCAMGMYNFSINFN